MYSKKDTLQTFNIWKNEKDNSINSLLKDDVIYAEVSPRGWKLSVEIVNKIIKQSIIQEASCRQCSRKNDIGISKCWFCECPNPC